MMRLVCTVLHCPTVHVYCCVLWCFDVVKFPTQGVVGKRKALMKSIELREKRKRKREELEVVSHTSVFSFTHVCLSVYMCV